MFFNNTEQKGMVGTVLVSPNRMILNGDCLLLAEMGTSLSRIKKKKNKKPKLNEVISNLDTLQTQIS